jgi:uncharacterized protein (DUF433 family)
MVQARMTRMLLNRVSVDEPTCDGKACVGRAHVRVALVLEMLAAGSSLGAVARAHGLAREDVRACIAFGAAMTRLREDS